MNSDSTARRLLVTLFVSLFGLPVFSGELSGQQWARKMFKEFEHDFGTLAKNEIAEFRFEIENVFKEDIKIRNVTTSCTCTAVSLTSHLLKSREKGYVVAVFNTRNFVGPKQATITVYFDQPFVGEIQLTVRGSIRGDVMFEPGAVDFGSLTQETIRTRSGSKQIQITKFNNVDWRIVDVKCAFSHVGVTLSNPTRVGNQVVYTMDVRIKDSAPAGFVQGELILVSKEYGRTTNIPVKFSAKIATALQISPEVLTFTAAKQGTVVEKKVVVKGSQPFRITDVTCSSSAFSVTADPEKSKKVHFVSVAYSADQPPGRYEYDLEFITDLNGKTTRIVKAVIEITASGEAEYNDSGS